MENSGAVTIEGENYEVVDECIEEEDTSNGIQPKCEKNTIVGKQLVDIASVDNSTSNNSTELNENVNVEKNNDTNMEKNEDTDIKRNENINIEENKNTDTEKNKDTNMEKNEETNIEQNENVNVEKNNDTNIEKNEDTNMQQNKNINIEENKDTNMEKNENTNIEQNENINIEKNKDANIEKNEDTNMEKSKDINLEKTENIDMEKNEEISVLDLTDAALSNNSNSDDIQNNTSHTENTNVEKCPQQSNVESIDFTADITLDQLDQQKDVTDEDVLHHLDEIENIVLNSSDFQVQEETDSVEEGIKNKLSNSEINRFVENAETNENMNTDKEISCNMSKDFEPKVKVEKPEKIEWYEKKLAEKETIVKERLTKVARVLGISYPCYEKWLEYEEKVNGSPLCKLKPSRHCCLDKPYTNRWKFICNRKRVLESTTRMDNCDTSFNKNVETVWKLEPSGAWGVNINNESQIPHFVLHAVKIFEDFLQTTEQLTSQDSMHANFSDDISIDIESKKDTNNEPRQDWLWLVVRCNSMDELMLFATGKNISRSTMDRLKQVYESGPGKDCNVKSLYCKSTNNKYDDTTVTDTTFLVGSEALDEIVGGLKVQLAPKTNFWSNTAGAENVANAVMDLLAPTPKTTVLEIGCGIGLIGLMMASKCQQVIGVDSPSEVEEAELTCELNNIKNASFIMGSPAEVTTKIIAAVKNRKTSAIINANTNIGRAIEIMSCLRKIPSLKRIVMITTLTKQSVRAILELARPGDHSHGSPFIPIVACVVDTLPIGAHFEAVILLQRRLIHKFNHLWLQKNMEEHVKNLENKNIQEKINVQNTNEADKKTTSKAMKLQIKRNFNKSLLKNSAKKSKISIKKNFTKNTDNSSTKNKFKGKRAHSPDKEESPPKKLLKKFNKFGAKLWHADITKKKKEWNAECPQLRINPLYEKKMREYKEQTDLRERLSNNRLDTDIAQTVKEHQALLEIAKEKLSGPAPTVDVNTAKQLQSMLNMVLEQTNKLQSQLPRSVWDRIAPPENINSDQRENKQDDPLLKGRYVQEMGFQDILITTPNKTFLDNKEPETKPIYKKYNNLLPLEPNTIMPVAQPINHRGERPFRIPSEQFHETDIRQQPIQENSWNRDKPFERSRWNEIGNIKKPISPMRRQTPPKRLSPKRPLLSPPRRPCSPPRRHFSPLHRPTTPMYRQRSPIRRQMSPLRRPMSPRRMSPTRRPLSPRRLSPPRRTEMIMNRPMSPLRRQVSPLRRQVSPMRSTISPSRRQTSPMKRPMSPLRRQIPSSNRQEMLLSRRQTMPQERPQTSTMRRPGSPPRFLFERPVSPPRRQQSPQRRQISPQEFADDWDIPSRGAIEQSTWARSIERMAEQSVWRTEKTSVSDNNWEQTACNDRRRKALNQEKWENAKDPIGNDTWNNGGNTWNSKQMCTKPMMKEKWTLSNDNRWSTTPNMPGSSNDNWNIRGKESFIPCKESWIDNKKQARWESLNVKESWKQSDKEDLDDLPEDAKDPWGDDGTSDLKERWLKFESTSTSSTWMRDNEQQGESWSKHNKDNWQSKGMSYGTKPQWQNNGVQNVGESRWLPQNDTDKKTQSSGWQNGNSVGSWQLQNSNFQSQRPFSTTQFKGLY